MGGVDGVRSRDDIDIVNKEEEEEVEGNYWIFVRLADVIGYVIVNVLLLVTVLVNVKLHTILTNSIEIHPLFNTPLVIPDFN